MYNNYSNSSVTTKQHDICQMSFHISQMMPIEHRSEKLGLGLMIQYEFKMRLSLWRVLPCLGWYRILVSELQQCQQCQASVRRKLCWGKQWGHK